MQKIMIVFLFLAAMLFLTATACQSDATPTAEPTADPTAVPPTTAIPPAPTDAPPEPTAVQEETTAETPPSGSVPSPALFETGWLDREPFRANLTAASQSILDETPNASVYHLDITVDDSLTQINGRQEVYYTNQEEVALDAVYFHLFPNVLGKSIVVSDVAVNGEAVAHALEMEDSVLRVPLPQPLEMGETAVIGINFVTEAPTESGRNYGIFAYVDDVLAMAHFYPIAAVYDDEGWNIDLPNENGDVVYADAAYFLVRLTAPEEQTIVAGGVETAHETADGKQTAVYASGPARDFYAVMSDQYIKVSEVVGETTINSYVLGDHLAEAQEGVFYAADSMQNHNGRFAPYPYTELDIASTPTLALGVEYPGIFVITAEEYNPESNYYGYLESTIAHEMAHQWFYNLVGNDQLGEPWLDEALAQYATLMHFEDQYGQQGWDGYYASLDGRWSRTDYAEIPIGQPVGAYDGAAYSGIIYGRGPIFVTVLEKEMGQDVFNAFMRDYFDLYSWEIADTESFKSLAEKHCDCDLTPLFEEWIY